MKVQETDPNYNGVINYDHQLTYPIHHDLFDVPYNSTRIMAPSWQNSPGEEDLIRAACVLLLGFIALTACFLLHTH